MSSEGDLEMDLETLLKEAEAIEHDDETSSFDVEIDDPSKVSTSKTEEGSGMLDTVAEECGDLLSQLNILLESQNKQIQERLSELTHLAASKPSEDESGNEQQEAESLVAFKDQDAEEDKASWTEITGLTFRHKPQKLDADAYPSCASGIKDQRLRCTRGNHSVIFGEPRNDINFVFEIQEPAPGDYRYRYAAQLSSSVAGTTSGQSWPSDDTRLAAFKWLEDAKKDLPLRAESAVEIQALRDKLSAATRRSDKEADLVAKAVNDVIVAKVEKKGTTGIALPRPRDGATVHQELYRAHQARLKELEERRDSLKERLSACTMAFVEAHARREAAEDECDGRQADPTEEQIEQMQKKKKAPRPWSAANNLRPPAAFTGGEMI